MAGRARGLALGADVLAGPADGGGLAAGAELDVALDPPHPAAARTPVSAAAARSVANRASAAPRVGSWPGLGVAGMLTS